MSELQLLVDSGQCGVMDTKKKKKKHSINNMTYSHNVWLLRDYYKSNMSVEQQYGYFQGYYYLGHSFYNGHAYIFKQAINKI